MGLLRGDIVIMVRMYGAYSGEAERPFREITKSVQLQPGMGVQVQSEQVFRMGRNTQHTTIIMIFTINTISESL